MRWGGPRPSRRNNDGDLGRLRSGRTRRHERRRAAELPRRLRRRAPSCVREAEWIKLYGEGRDVATLGQVLFRSQQLIVHEVPSPGAARHFYFADGDARMIGAAIVVQGGPTPASPSTPACPPTPTSSHHPGQDQPPGRYLGPHRHLVEAPPAHRPRPLPKRGVVFLAATRRLVNPRRPGREHRHERRDRPRVEAPPERSHHSAAPSCSTPTSPTAAKSSRSHVLRASGSPPSAPPNRARPHRSSPKTHPRRARPRPGCRTGGRAPAQGARDDRH